MMLQFAYCIRCVGSFGTVPHQTALELTKRFRRSCYKKKGWGLFPQWEKWELGVKLERDAAKEGAAKEAKEVRCSWVSYIITLKR
eukprot:139764-Prorocentrum_minimum.AAC.1